jgi:hypothetical protein
MFQRNEPPCLDVDPENLPNDQTQRKGKGSYAKTNDGHLDETL